MRVAASSGDGCQKCLPFSKNLENVVQSVFYGRFYVNIYTKQAVELNKT